MAGAVALAGAKPNQRLIMSQKPSAGAGAAAALPGRCGTTGAGPRTSDKMPLITGLCLLVGSLERRVTVVVSSISSAIW